ncbi:MAG: tetratricopeptide repeat protein [Sulfuriferula sp.]
MNRTALLALFFALIVGFSASAHAASATELQEINSLYKHTQYTAALERVNAYISKNPNDAQARFLKGLILTGQHKSAEAIDVFTSLNEDFPELAEPYNNLAALYAAQGHYDKAEKALQAATHLNPNYAVAEENLGDIYAKMAAIAYAKALQLDSKNTSVSAKISLIKEIFNPPKPANIVNKVNAKQAK